MNRHERYRANCALIVEAFREACPLRYDEKVPYAAIVEHYYCADVILNDYALGARFGKAETQIARIIGEGRSVVWYGPERYATEFSEPYKGRGWQARLGRRLAEIAIEHLAELCAKFPEVT